MYYVFNNQNSSVGITATDPVGARAPMKMSEHPQNLMCFWYNANTVCTPHIYRRITSKHRENDSKAYGAALSNSSRVTLMSKVI